MYILARTGEGQKWTKKIMSMSSTCLHPYRLRGEQQLIFGLLQNFECFRAFPKPLFTFFLFLFNSIFITTFKHHYNKSLFSQISAPFFALSLHWLVIPSLTSFLCVNELINYIYSLRFCIVFLFQFV